jgi:hypothetical protein
MLAVGLLHSALRDHIVYASIYASMLLVPSVGSALGCWVKAGWDWLFIFLQDALLK